MARETEQFSFIRTITVYSHQENSDRSSAPKTNSTKNNSSQNTLTLPKSSKPLSSELALQSDSPITINKNWYTTNTDNEMSSSLSNVIVLPNSDFDFLPEKKKSFFSYLDKLLLVLATLYSGLIIWWLFGSNQALFALPWFPENSQISQADVEFIEYMQKSLDLVKVRENNNYRSSATSENSVFVPVYTPTPNAPSPSPLQALPKLLPPPPPNQIAAMNPPLSATPITPPPAPKKTFQKIPTLNPPHPPQVLDKTALVQETPVHTLVGAMELKENSAALFKVDGITQRVWIGNRIENTDWTLESVSDQKVTISRGGQSRILSLGETF